MFFFIVHAALSLAAMLSGSAIPEFSISNDQLCNPSGLLFRYSGLRVYSSVMFDWPVRHFWTVARCNAGEVVALQYFPCTRSDNFAFSGPLQLDSGEWYIFARKKKYASRNVPIFRPRATLGAVYQFNKETNATEILAPLTADNPASSFSLNSPIGHKISYVPLMSASFDTHRGWDEGLEVSPYEYYTYSEDDTKSRWYRVNTLLNDIDSYTYVNDRFVFWEFDATEKQLSGTARDWRKYVNALIPDI